MANEERLQHSKQFEFRTRTALEKRKRTEHKASFSISAKTSFETLLEFFHKMTPS